MNSKTIYAVDFGTSNSLLSVIQGNKILGLAHLEPSNPINSSTLRSLIYFSTNEQPSFGQQAINSYSDEHGEGRFIRSIKKYLPYESFTGTRINNKFYSLEELIGRFLNEMKIRADKQFGCDARHIVLGRPAKFSLDPIKDQLAQDRLEKAAHLAGFERIEFFPEPLAAAYDFKNNIIGEKIVLIVDLGGGTSDFTVIKLHQGAFKDSDVLSMGGVAVAGNSIDGELMGSKVAHNFGSKVSYQLPMSTNVLTMPKGLKHSLMSPADIVLMSRKNIMKFLNEIKKCTINSNDKDYLENLFYLINNNLGFSIFEEIEKTKIEVCKSKQYTFNFHEGEIDIEEDITFAEFKNITQAKIEKIFATMDEVLKLAEVKKEDIDLICSTGGSSKLPQVKDELIRRFGELKVQSYKNFHSIINGLAEKAKSVGF